MLSSGPPTGGQSLVGHRAEIAQLVEHATENRGVASSILALGTTSAVVASSSGSGSVGRASPCQGEGRGFESRLPLHFLAREGDRTTRQSAAAPSSSGRTADFGSVNRGSNPRGAANRTGSARRGPSAGSAPAYHRWRRGEVAQHGGLQNLYSPVRIRSSPPLPEYDVGESVAQPVQSPVPTRPRWSCSTRTARRLLWRLPVPGRIRDAARARPPRRPARQLVPLPCRARGLRGPPTEIPAQSGATAGADHRRDTRVRVQPGRSRPTRTRQPAPGRHRRPSRLHRGAPRKRSSSPCSGGGDGIGLVARPPSGPTGKPPSRPASPTTGSNDRAATVRSPGARRWRLTAAATADRAPSPVASATPLGARKGRVVDSTRGYAG